MIMRSSSSEPYPEHRKDKVPLICVIPLPVRLRCRGISLYSGSPSHEPWDGMGAERYRPLQVQAAAAPMDRGEVSEPKEYGNYLGT